MEIYGQGSEIKNMHIKDKKQLLDLGESAKFITSKLGELEKDQKEKEKIINNLKGELSYMSEKLRKWKRVSILSSNTLKQIVCFSMALKKLKVKILTILS